MLAANCYRNMLSCRTSVARNRAHVISGHCLTSRGWRRSSQGARHGTAQSVEGNADSCDPDGAKALPPLANAQQDGQWLAEIIKFWLDEEWSPLEIHADVGQAAGDAYVRLRRGGAEDMGDLVLSLATELLAFDFSDSFVNAFEVSNKVVELLMMRNGVDVCCTSDEDKTLIERFASSAASPSGRSE